MNLSYSPRCVAFFFLLDSSSYAKVPFHQPSFLVERTSLDMFQNKNYLNPLDCKTVVHPWVSWTVFKQTRWDSASNSSTEQTQSRSMYCKSPPSCTQNLSRRLNSSLCTIWNNSWANLYLIFSATTCIANRNAAQCTTMQNIISTVINTAL